MVGDDRPTAPPEVSRSDDGDPFGPLPPGTRVAKYEIVEMLGQGGFGITYRARDPQLHRDVALKEYLPTAFARRQGGGTVVPRSTHTAEDFLWGRARFLDEARTLARLEDAPGIVNVYDFMEANGTAYMVMALVRGETLEARLKRDRRLQQPAIELLLYPLLDGLEIVHEAGFLHRDIKPANILIDHSGRPTLIDFGASRVALLGRTKAMTAIYTPGYAAPEQMTSAKQGPWTDIYAVAGTLHHCVTGRPPPSAMDRVTGDALVPAVEAGRGRYAPSLLATIDAGLRLKALDRPQSIADWRRVLAGLSPTMGEVPTGPATREMDAPVTRRVSAAGRRRLRLAWVAMGIVALTVAGGGGWMLRSPPETAEQTLRRVEAETQRQAALLAKLRQEEEARQRTAAEATRKAEQEAARKAAEEKEAGDVAARRQTDETERQRAAAEAARRKAEEEVARRAAEEKVAAEAVARRKTEEEAASRAATEAARRRAEEQARAEAEAKRKAEQEATARKAAEEKTAAAEAAAKRKAEEEAATRAAAEAKRKAEVAAKEKAEAEAAARHREDEARRAAEEKARTDAAAREAAEAEARARAEEEAKRKTADETRQAAEEKTKADADVKRQAEAGEAALRLSEQDRKRVQVALTSLGHDTRGTDGAFGPRTRQMIASWQRSQRAPETGYLAAVQLVALRQQAASALARYDEAQKKTEEEAKRQQEDDAKKRAEDSQRRAQQPQAAAAPATTAPPAVDAAGVDGRWVGALRCDAILAREDPIALSISNGRGTYRQNPLELAIEVRGERVSVSLLSAGSYGSTVRGELSGRVTGMTIDTAGTLRNPGGAGFTGAACTMRLTKQ